MLYLIFVLDKESSPMSTYMIEDALRHYPPSIVQRTIQGFFLDNGRLFIPEIEFVKYHINIFEQCDYLTQNTITHNQCVIQKMI
jgi:hypothetical protein